MAGISFEGWCFFLIGGLSNGKVGEVTRGTFSKTPFWLDTRKETFWPEARFNCAKLILILCPLQVFSALTMLFPAFHGYFQAPDIAEDAAFPQGSYLNGIEKEVFKENLKCLMSPAPGVWVLWYAATFHCPISMAYHLANAIFDGYFGKK